MLVAGLDEAQLWVLGQQVHLYIGAHIGAVAINTAATVEGVGPHAQQQVPILRPRVVYGHRAEGITQLQAPRTEPHAAGGRHGVARRGVKLHRIRHQLMRRGGGQGSGQVAQDHIRVDGRHGIEILVHIRSEALHIRLRVTEECGLDDGPVDPAGLEGLIGVVKGVRHGRIVLSAFVHSTERPEYQRYLCVGEVRILAL